jgi:alpha-1,6-mannosyltransferase
VDYHAFGPAHLDAELRSRLLGDAGGDAHSILLLYAGRISPEKNIPLLLDALEHVQRLFRERARHDYRLVLAGDGPLVKPMLDGAERRVPGRVHWIGSIGERERLARIYASADVFVHPNPNEPFGIGPLEAMASHVPVVVPSAGGVVTYANVRNAWLASPDGPSFARAIDQAAHHPDPRRLAEARRTALRLDWPEVAARYFRLYDACHGRRRSAEAARAGLVHPSSVEGVEVSTRG